MSYKSAPHVLATFTEQVVPIHKYIPLLWIPSKSGTTTVTSALHTLQLGATLSRGTQNSELKPPNKISSPQIEIWNTRTQWSFCQSVSFSVL